MAEAEPTDIHEWIRFTNQRDRMVMPLVDVEAAAFYDDIRNIDRHHFIQDIHDRLAPVRKHQGIAETLYNRYETAFLTRQEVLNEPRSNAKSSGRIDARIQSQVLRDLERERVALDLVRSWRGYLTDWVDRMTDLIELWDDMFDWVERGLYEGIRFDWDGRVSDVRQTAALLTKLRELEVRVDFARRGAIEKAEGVLGLGGYGGSS